ncbi:ATP-binding protein [Streptomyces sp. NPDC052015]|uniref:ATP-binding protein n=1 Tax=Streptomyces sp. NPDC052015 TaxID=3154755 RepID=UPI0034122109
MNPPTHHQTSQPGEAGTPIEPEAGTHPVSSTVTLTPLQQDEPRYKWQTKLTANPGAGPNARLRVRTRLTVANWAGNIDAASRVADKLVDNAIRHAKPFGSGEGWIELRLTVKPETDDLLIEVDDALSEFANFEAAAAVIDIKGTPSGLWWVHHYKGTLSWDVKRDTAQAIVGKTVQALIPASWGEESV